MIIGKGPYLDELRNKTKAVKGIFFTGRIARKDLVDVYSACDLFLFPSTTDTFGMVVMEAQACELPAIVSDVGGPKEIIIDGITGKTAKSNDMNDWLQKLDVLLTMKENSTTNFLQMKREARKNVLRRYSWESVLESIMEREESLFFKDEGISAGH